jgi:preprotein translocase subunit SecD
MRVINPKHFLPLVTCLTLAALAATPPKPSIFEIRPVLDAPSADSEQLEMTSADGQAMVLNVQRVPLLDESYVQSAAAAQDSETGQVRIQIMLTPQGQKRLAEVTRQNLHRRIAVVVDGKLCEAPMIQAEITGGAVPIRGDFTQPQASELAARINADAGKK